MAVLRKENSHSVVICRLIKNHFVSLKTFSAKVDEISQVK